MAASARAAAEEGRRQMVVVAGEMGIGKTTLIEKFAASLGGHRNVLRCQCVEQYGAREPYMPLLEATAPAEGDFIVQFAVTGASNAVPLSLIADSRGVVLTVQCRDIGGKGF